MSPIDLGGAAAGGVRTVVLIPADTIAPTSIDWIWPGRLARGVFTNCVGLPDQGKTLVCIDVAARLTTGAPMPPEPRRPDARVPQRVMILTHEDNLAATMIPRLMRAAADLSRLDFVQMVKGLDGRASMITLATDIEAIEAALVAEDYAALIVDGLMNYLGPDTKTHNDAAVRHVLTPFAALLERTGVAGIGIMHPPKQTSNLAYYAGGSVAFTSVPRVVLGVAPDPEDDRPTPRRFLAKIKGNLYGYVPTLSYQIRAESDDDVPGIEWAIDPVSVNIADVFDPPKETPEDRTSRRACQEWLRNFLGDGMKPASAVEEAAKAAGFKKRTIERAKAGVVDSVKERFDGPWLWFVAGSR